MARQDLHAFIQHLCRRLSVHSGAGPSDTELLSRWVACRDDAAFELLLRRHAPSVLGVCRRLLRDPRDVEDAFQATFLLLVRKASSIRQGQVLGSWLYKVAYRVALRARSRAPVPTPADLDSLPAPADEGFLWRDLRPVLDDEVQRLPEKYRAAFVLCHLEGKTNQEAADALGCPPGTILSRLSWARQRLRARLTRRGLTVSVAALATVLAENAAPAAVSPVLVQATLATSVYVTTSAVTATGASVRPFLLAKGVLKTMFLTKLKLTAVAVAAAGLLVLGAFATVYRTEAAPEPGVPRTPRPPKGTAKHRNPIIVPASRAGVVQLIGRPVKPGEKVPTRQLITVRIGGMEWKYRRLVEGDRVAKGDLLARLNDTLASQNLAIQQAKVAASEAELRVIQKTGTEARSQYERIWLGDLGDMASRAEEQRSKKLTWERYDLECIEKERARNMARAEMEMARIVLEMHEIRSPVDGVIERVFKKKGEAVRRREAVFRIRLKR